MGGQAAAGRTTRSALTDALVSLRSGDKVGSGSLRETAGAAEGRAWMSVCRQHNLVKAVPTRLGFLTQRVVSLLQAAVRPAEAPWRPQRRRLQCERCGSCSAGLHRADGCEARNNGDGLRNRRQKTRQPAGRRTFTAWHELSDSPAQLIMPVGAHSFQSHRCRADDPALCVPASTGLGPHTRTQGKQHSEE